MTKNVTIEITRHSRGCFSADLKNLPGSPPIGLGRTRVMALACLLYKLLPNAHGPLTVNGKLWKDAPRASTR